MFYGDDIDWMFMLMVFYFLCLVQVIYIHILLGRTCNLSMYKLCTTLLNFYLRLLFKSRYFFELI